VQTIRRGPGITTFSKNGDDEPLLSYNPLENNRKKFKIEGETTYHGEDRRVRGNQEWAKKSTKKSVKGGSGGFLSRETNIGIRLQHGSCPKKGKMRRDPFVTVTQQGGPQEGERDTRNAVLWEEISARKSGNGWRGP